MSDITASRNRLPTGRLDFSGTAFNTLLLAIGIQTAILIMAIPAMGLDDRTINDINVWIKPVKFATSLLSTLGIVALLLPLLDQVTRESRLIRISAWLMAFFSTLEIFYIALQSARGRASHFNDTTIFEQVSYGIMGIGAVSIVVGAFLIGLTIWRKGRQDFGLGLRSGAALGLMLGAVLTLITAGIMSSGMLGANSHWVGGMRSDLNGVWLMGWSRTGGDLRVPHFFATHLMQALPLLGLVADRMMPTRAGTIVLAGSLIGTAIVVATFIQAAMGHAFI